MSKLSPSRPAAEIPSRVRRGYFECRYGQLHVHHSIPSGGGFEEGTPLLCLHPSPLSGRVFVQFLAAAGVRRSVFAPDLPGFGESDPPAPGAGVPEHTAGIGDFLDAMRLRQIDLLGQGFGALVATELAATRTTQVRRLVLVSPPAAEIPEAGQRAPSADGSHLLDEWRRAGSHCGPGAPPELINAALAERLRNGLAGAAATAAERGYPLRSRLAASAVPILVLRLRDEVAAHKGQPRDLPARARHIELPAHGASLFETAPEAAAQALEPFLR
jgi:pimeloyl-ACP methyl ester carboxylesterase